VFLPAIDEAELGPLLLLLDHNVTIVGTLSINLLESPDLSCRSAIGFASGTAKNQIFAALFA
jgi:hypothetical protein